MSRSNNRHFRPPALEKERAVAIICNGEPSRRPPTIGPDLWITHCRGHAAISRGRLRGTMALQPDCGPFRPMPEPRIGDDFDPRGSPSDSTPLRQSSCYNRRISRSRPNSPTPVRKESGQSELRATGKKSPGTALLPNRHRPIKIEPC